MSKSKVKTIKKDRTLIESLIVNSKEIINLKNAITLSRLYIYSVQKCTYSLIQKTRVIEEQKELRRRVKELMIHNANILKARYSHQFKITFDEFLISTAEMGAGFVSFRSGTDQHILFLSDCTVDFLEEIKAGELVKATPIINEKYLSNCKPVWHPNSLNDLYLEHINIIK